MKIIKKIKISEKLILTSVLNTIFIITVGIIGLTNMNKINNSAQDMYNNNLLSLEKLYSIQNNVNNIVLDLEHILNSNFQIDIDSIEKDINDINNENNKLYEEYEKIPFATQAEKEAYNKVKITLIQYRDLRNIIINYAKEGNYTDGNKLYNSEYIKLKEQLLDELNTLIENNISDAQNMSEENNATFRSSFLLQILIIVISSLYIHISGVSMALWLKRRINTVVGFANNLAHGDLSNNITITAEDELGNMAKALNTACSNMKELIAELINGMQNMSASSEELTATMEEVSATIVNIRESTQEIAEGNNTLSSSTEEISATTEEIGTHINYTN